MKKIKNYIIVFLIIINGCDKEFSYDFSIYEKIVGSINKGLAYLEEENYIEAARQFENITELAPKEPLGYANLGLCYMRSDDELDKSEGYFNKAIELDPNNPNIRILLAIFYELSNNDSLAFQILKQIEEISPNHIKTLFKLSQYFNNLKKI